MVFLTVELALDRKFIGLISTSSIKLWLEDYILVQGLSTVFVK